MGRGWVVALGTGSATGLPRAALSRIRGKIIAPNAGIFAFSSELLEQDTNYVHERML